MVTCALAPTPPSPSTTHLVVFSAPQTLQRRIRSHVGDVLWGDNSTGEFNEFWDLIRRNNATSAKARTNRIGFGAARYALVCDACLIKSEWDDNSLVTFQRWKPTQSTVVGGHAHGYVNASVRQFRTESRERSPLTARGTAGLSIICA